MQAKFHFSHQLGWRVLVALFGAICGVSSVFAGEYKALSTAADRSSLTIVSSHGEHPAPRTQEEQRGFSDARISPDGNSVGWLALVDSCCTSYPLPMAVVIFKQGKVVRTITEEQPIFNWSFVRHGSAVAYQQTFPHGLVPYYYKLRRISDGKLLEKFECVPVNQELNTPPRYKNSGPVPSWVWPLAVNADCPVR